MGINKVGSSGELAYAPVKDKSIEAPSPKIQDFKLPHNGAVDKIA